ncbi:hypothetical protein A2631_05170 [Candidatus Daviesbacteria bacterium RIFCSPHIGHO2_01_FULL_44_29]|uniref:RNase H type-1 domain-containing protein n=1 Tax=Candidatus Daviesbacteria bacterium RIFCSPHIGHO2_02_FULL_43_12 TaxID=1797776 RepID=A0A1F5KH20_9BACT|nr:MAG: hypothetical protein A2631_05170 [Candidatus Daviesbacteria bacterium RIFCSPHIGHO2_01_FULL_44_29]OGE40110.1 MAG: hypothetical protein A3D25_04890 [Candidatus Daviesbacteria bacterium RIFCSPHIGHO2_02_FULL_43_12]OGE41059.1 MAG: hypothetical protein A3E86_04995 [Candidatus Daviesbacteria bacterium RIFCSPHIGHO2_12_FULL_47_45]OGE70208.1 MAG: hypothetical protein A3B55_00670 [Candidatus Daviesbacteria bacterium RIFCSPLOWO2_01_FULL_43_15]
MNFIIFTDGASRGNPGPASYGFVVKDTTGLILHEEAKELGVTTNNVAEYTAVLRAFQYILAHFADKAPHKITFFMDSLLVVQQLSGRYKIKSPHLKELVLAIKELEMQFFNISYTHIPRKDNFLADRLANMALDHLV